MQYVDMLFKWDPWDPSHVGGTTELRWTCR